MTEYLLITAVLMLSASTASLALVVWRQRRVILAKSIHIKSLTKMIQEKREKRGKKIGASKPSELIEELRTSFPDLKTKAAEVDWEEMAKKEFE